MTNLTRFGPVGLRLDLLQPAFTMRIHGGECLSFGTTLGRIV